jgi:transposase
MARKQRAVPLRQHYSRDLKRRVIHMSQKLHLSSTEIAIMLDMPLRVVQRVRQVWNEIGEVCQHRARSGRAPLMSRQAVDVCSPTAVNSYLKPLDDARAA